MSSGVAHLELDALMGRLADGDRDAFSPLFRALWPPALRVCERMLYREADAADAAQGAMMKILERAGEYDKSRPALPWAMGIAAWECRTLLKRQERKKETVGNLGVSDGGVGAEELEQRVLIEAVLHAMGTLSDTDKDALLATYWDAAAAVGGATLRKRRERALTRLRNSFRRMYGLG